MVYKRKASRQLFTSRYKPYSKPRSTLRTKSKIYPRRKATTKFARRIMRVVNRSAETKCAMRSLVQNGTIEHNSLINLSNNALQTAIGVRGESINNTSPTGGCRSGKKIYAKGLSCSLMIEQSQKRALCHYWLYLVRNKFAPDNQIIDKDQMFEGVSDIIPMDYIDPDLVDIMFCKKIRISMPNQATAKDMVAGSGLANLAEQDNLSKAVITNPQRIEKFYVPLNRTITYRDYHLTPANALLPLSQQRYQWVLAAYDNASTTDETDIGKITFSTKLKFTDV